LICLSRPSAALQKALQAADHLRDKFGESSIGLENGMKGGFREAP